MNFPFMVQISYSNISSAVVRLIGVIINQVFNLMNFRLPIRLPQQCQNLSINLSNQLATTLDYTRFDYAAVSFFSVANVRQLVQSVAFLLMESTHFMGPATNFLVVINLWCLITRHAITTLYVKEKISVDDHQSQNSIIKWKFSSYNFFSPKRLKVNCLSRNKYIEN